MAAINNTSMKRDSAKVLITLFFLVAVGNLISHMFAMDWLEYATKPFLMILLLLIFTSGCKDQKSAPFRLTVIALLFSWLGDIFLLFQTMNENLFIFGLISFLIAHVFYIIDYRKLRLETEKYNKSRTFINVRIIFLLMVGIALYSVLFNHIGDLKIPIFIYTLVIITMAITAVQRKGRTGDKSFLLVYFGALLFIMSDSMIAIDKFIEPIIYGRVLIMSTYILAQYLIIQGILKHKEEEFDQSI